MLIARAFSPQFRGHATAVRRRWRYWPVFFAPLLGWWLIAGGFASGAYSGGLSAR